MLRVPAAGEVTPPLVERKIEKVVPVSLPESFQRSQAKKTANEVASAAPSGEVRRRRRQPQENDQPDWERARTERLVRISKPGKSRKGLWWVAGIVTGCAVGALVMMAMRDTPSPQPIAIAPVLETPAAIKESVPEQIELPREMDRSETELIKELEPLARGFLEADTVAKLLPFVRDSGRLEEKIRAYYPDGKVPAPGMSAFNTRSAIAYRGKLASVSVRTGDFMERQIAFLRMDDGMKIDWESFVGWSEMPWQRFIEEKPERPVLFRVGLKMQDYYNFSFADEKKWQSYEIRFPDGEHILYGYVRRDSPLDVKLRPLDAKSSRLVMVRLKFPPGGTKRNQVIIEEMPADGWVEGAGK
ncbi:MAG: hypothetical protein EOP87_00855 [Verrucomicrobiaceae bacterium]|nr:MAG: hypothetical protein EOP87_00855 [Verrucomicrobiaceae bacterium]